MTLAKKKDCASAQLISMNPKSDGLAVKKNSCPPALPATIQQSNPSSSSLLSRTKHNFSQFFKNERYNYLSPLKHMFRLKKDELTIRTPSNLDHEYVNEIFIGKHQNESNRHVNKSNFFMSSSSSAAVAAAAVTTASSSAVKSTIYQAPIKRPKKLRKKSTFRQRKFLNLKAKEKLILNAIEKSKDLKVPQIPAPIYRSIKLNKQVKNKPTLLMPPPAPPLTPFLRNAQKRGPAQPNRLVNESKSSQIRAQTRNINRPQKQFFNDAKLTLQKNY